MKRPKTNRIDLDPIVNQLGESAQGSISINDKGVVTALESDGSNTQRMVPTSSLPARKKNKDKKQVPNLLIRSEFQGS